MTTPPPARTGHPYYMHDAILRQPAALAEMQDKHAQTVRPLAVELAAKRHIYIVGIGTSWHAVLVAEHWFRRLVGAAVPVDGCHSFEFCAYPPPLTGDDAVIVVSHRGTKTYSFLALELAKAQGAYTVSITSTAPGPRLQIADAELNTVEPEVSAAFNRQLHRRLDGVGNAGRRNRRRVGRQPGRRPGLGPTARRPGRNAGRRVRRPQQ